MSHKALRLLVERTVKSLHDSIQYSYGEETTFNQAEKKDFVMVNVTLMPSNGNFSVNDVQNQTKVWTINLSWYKFDRDDSIDYYKIHDEIDPLCDKFLRQLNREDLLLITGFSQTPFVKALADVLTGYLQTVTVRVPDDLPCDEC